MSRQRGSLGPFRDPPVISLGCFGEEAKDEYSVPDTFPFFRFPWKLEETRRVVTFSPSYVFATRRNDDVYCVVLSMLERIDPRDARRGNL